MDNDTTLKITNLSRGTSTPDVANLFSRYGPLRGVSIEEEEDRYAKRRAIVEFEDPRDAKDALSLDGHELNGKRIRVSFYKKRGITPKQPSSRVTVTINGQDYVSDDPEIAEMFFKIMEMTGRISNQDTSLTAYVEYEYEDDLYRAADELDRARMDGRTLRVTLVGERLRVEGIAGNKSLHDAKELFGTVGKVKRVYWDDSKIIPSPSRSRTKSRSQSRSLSSSPRRTNVSTLNTLSSDGQKLRSQAFKSSKPRR